MRFTGREKAVGGRGAEGHLRRWAAVVEVLAADGQAGSAYTGRTAETTVEIPREGGPDKPARYEWLVGYFRGPSAVSITNAASASQRRGAGFNSSRTSSAVVPLNSPLYLFFASYAATARRTTGCSSGVKFMTVI